MGKSYKTKEKEKTTATITQLWIVIGIAIIALCLSTMFIGHALWNKAQLNEASEPSKTASPTGISKPTDDGNVYSVTFHNMSREPIGTFEATSTGYVLPPRVEQQVGGKVFIGWNDNLVGFISDVEVYQKIRDMSERTNAFYIGAYYFNNGEDISVDLGICGIVKISGFSITVTYDSEALTFIGIENAPDSITYEQENEGSVVIKCASTELFTQSTVLATLCFTPHIPDFTLTELQLAARDLKAVENGIAATTVECATVNGYIYFFEGGNNQ